MQQAQPGDMAIVDFKLGGTETRTMTYGGGGGGTLFMGTGMINNGWVRSEAIQTNTIPMPDGAIRKMTVNPGEEEVLPGSRLSAACFMGRKGRWHWIAVKNHETGDTLTRTFSNGTAKKIDMEPPLFLLKSIGSAVLVGGGGLLAVLAMIEAGVFPPGNPMPIFLLFAAPIVGLIFFAWIMGRLYGPLKPNKIKRQGRKLLKVHEWGADGVTVGT